MGASACPCPLLYGVGLYNSKGFFAAQAGAANSLSKKPPAAPFACIVPLVSAWGLHNSKGFFSVPNPISRL